MWTPPAGQGVSDLFARQSAKGAFRQDRVHRCFPIAPNICSSLPSADDLHVVLHLDRAARLERDRRRRHMAGFAQALAERIQHVYTSGWRKAAEETDYGHRRAAARAASGIAAAPPRATMNSRRLMPVPRLGIWHRIGLNDHFDRGWSRLN